MLSDQLASRGMAEWIEGAGRGQRSSARSPPGRTEEKPATLSKASQIAEGRSRAFEPMMIGQSGFLLWIKLSFNCDHRSTYSFKNLSSFQKVNSFVCRTPLRKKALQLNTLHRRGLEGYGGL
jgi:hypothetical protein